MKIMNCPECDKEVVLCDNSVYLDYPAVDYDEVKAPWTIMIIAQVNFGLTLASIGNPGTNDKGHSLHEHQPSESVMARK